MDEGTSDILDGIRALRAKAAEKLTGNEYYLIVQQLDSLAMSTEQTDATRDALGKIEARINDGAAAGDGSFIVIPRAGSFGGSAGTRAIGLAEVAPVAAEVSGQADAPEATAEPATQDSPPLRSGLAVAAETIQPLIETQLSGNNYYMAAYLLERLRNLPAPKNAGAPPEAPADFAAALGLLTAETGRLSGLVRDEAAYLVTALQNLVPPKPAATPEAAAAAEPPAPKPEVPEPPAPAEAPAPPTPAEEPDTPAPDEAPQNPAPIEDPAPDSTPAEPSTPAPEVPASQAAAPEPEQTAEAAAAPAAAEPAQPDLADAPDPQPDPGPQTGFDRLAQESWQRVKSVAQADRSRLAGLNGGTPVPIPAAASEPAAPPPAPEPLTAEMSEALDDGGSERRSSEPCYAADFEPAAQPAPSDHTEPSGEAALSQEAEAPGEAAAPAEAEIVTAAAVEDSAAPAEAGMEILEAAIATAETGSGETVAEAIEAVEAVAAVETAEIIETAAVVDEPELTELEVETAEVIEPAVVTEAAETAPAAVTEPAAATVDEATAEAAAAPAAEPEPVAEAKAEPAPPAEAAAAAPPETAASAETPPKAPEAEPQKTSGKASKGGFFSRLFGGRSAEFR